MAAKMWPRAAEAARLVGRGAAAAGAGAGAVVVVGPRGIGKTTLVRRALRSLPSTLWFDGGGEGGFVGRVAAMEEETLRAVSALREAGGPAVTHVDVFRTLMPRHATPADVIGMMRRKEGEEQARDHVVATAARTAAPAPIETIWLDGVRKYQRERGRAPIAPPLQLAYDVLLHKERAANPTGARTGLLVTPFLMDVLHETIVEKTWTPQLVLENMPRPANAAETAWLHSVLKRSTDVPVVVDADHHSYFAHALEAEVPGTPLEFLEVDGLELAQAKLWLAGNGRCTEADVEAMHARLGGHPAHLDAVAADGGPAAVDAFLDRHAASFAGKIDACLAASRFEDAPDKAPTAQETAELRRHFVDLVDRLSSVNFAVNYADAMGTEFLENSIVRVFLDAELLHQQRHPTYIRPLSVADQHALRRWLQAQLASLKGWAWLRYRLYRATRGVGSLKHLHYVARFPND